MTSALERTRRVRRQSERRRGRLRGRERDDDDSIDDDDDDASRATRKTFRTQTIDFDAIDREELMEEMDFAHADARWHRAARDDDARSVAARVVVSTLEPLFASPSDALARAIAKLTPRKSDHMALIRARGKKRTTQCGRCDGGRARRRRSRANAARHRARWLGNDFDGVPFAFDGKGEERCGTGHQGDANARARAIMGDVDGGDDGGGGGGDAGGGGGGDGDGDAGDGAYAALLRIIASEREENRGQLPENYTLDEVRENARGRAMDDVKRLSEAFAREDERVGALTSGLGLGVAHVLRDDRGEAIGYTLTYENRAPEWDRSRAIALPPRLAHVYITPERRSRGLGTALTRWWTSRFALSCAFFAVDSPNTSMHRTLGRLECALATTRSGHGASSVHYVATAPM